METLSGTVQKILWSSPDPNNHYRVFKLRCRGNRYETITGDFEELIEGAEVEIHGDFKDHPRYGRGFKAKAHVFSFDRDSTYSISLYMQSIAKFLGPKRAFLIAKEFGSEIEDIIEKTPEKLSEVEGIGTVVAKNLVTAWYQHKEEKSIKLFLYGLGLKEKKIKKVLTTFGIESENKIRENPYLLSLVDFGFSTCDFIARKLNFKPDNPLRFRYFIIYALKEALNSGHLFLYDDQIVKIFNNYNKHTTYNFKTDEIKLDDLKKPLKKLIKDGYIIREKNRYYYLENYFFENESARILSLIKKKEDFCSKFKDLNIKEFIKKYEKEQKSNTGISDFSLSEEQKDAIRSFIEEKILIITGGPGTGKCLAKDTPILMFDGTIKAVQEIKVGDIIMGDDSTPRKILSLAHGTEEMFKVSPAEGVPYVVNKSHILSLIASKTNKYKRDTKIDISVSEYLKLPLDVRKDLKGYRVSVEFKEKNIPIDPYLVGFWLGYDNQEDIDIPVSFLEDIGIYKNRHIPHQYKCNSKKNRLELLAGIFDSGSFYEFKDSGFDIVLKCKKLTEDTEYLAKSLGYKTRLESCNDRQKGFKLHISGKGLEDIPVVGPIKKATFQNQSENTLWTDITIQGIGEGEYFGFEIDGNKRFLLGDFTVTHNTTITKAFVRLMLDHYVSFELLSPTGIAAKKLGNITEYEAYTIHRRLGYQGSSWGYDAHNKYNTDVVIVDEVSMVDMEVFYRLISALYPHTKLIFVGDNDQLPSVGPGRVLNQMIQSKSIKTISLHNIFRQAEQSDIIKQARRIRDGNIDLDLLSQNEKADIWFLRSNKLYWIEDQIVKFSRQLKDFVKNKKKKTTFQIITPRNSGPLSVETLNIALQSALNPKIENEREINLNTCIIRRGDRVLIKKNNYQLDVYNGDIGKVINISNGYIVVEIDSFEGPRQVEIPIEQAEEMLKLAYAISAHKSQGSEYDCVILPIVKSHGKRILQRNLLYTAVTRAKKKVIVIGQSAAIVDAIENDKIQERNTLLAERIRKWIRNEGISLRQLYGNPSNYPNAENLKRLLLYEEKALKELVSIDQSQKGNEDEETMKKKPHPVPFSKQSQNISLTKVLKEIEESDQEMKMKNPA